MGQANTYKKLLLCITKLNYAFDFYSILNKLWLFFTLWYMGTQRYL